MAAEVKALPGELDIAVYQGDSFTLSVQMQNSDETPQDLTGATFRSQLRSTHSADTVLAEFTVTVVDAANGELTLTLTSAQTAVLPTRCVYDLQQQRDADIQTILVGAVIVKREVTRA